MSEDGFTAEDVFPGAERAVDAVARGVQVVRRAVMTAPEDKNPATFLQGFHSCALAAYVLVGLETDQWPPDRELTRQWAYDLYEYGKTIGINSFFWGASGKIGVSSPLA